MRAARWLAVAAFVACSASRLPADPGKPDAPQAPAPRLVVRPVSDECRPELFELIDDAFKQPAYRYVHYDKRKPMK